MANTEKMIGLSGAANPVEPSGLLVSRALVRAASGPVLGQRRGAALLCSSTALPTTAAFT